MALIWLRVCPTYEVLVFFSPYKADAQRGAVEAALG